jgi:hypothetical protein
MCCTFSSSTTSQAPSNTLSAAPTSQTLLPGTYTNGGAVAFNSPVYLNCGGNNNAVFNFVIGGALSFNNNVLRINGLCYVHWAVNGAMSIAANFQVDGNVDATGACNILANAELNGCAICGGALTFGAGGSVQCSTTVSPARSLCGAGSLNIAPGTYYSTGAVAYNADAQLDCQGNNASVFNFVIAGAVAFNANVYRINGNCQVTWTVNGAVAIAAGIILFLDLFLSA